MLHTRHNAPGTPPRILIIAGSDSGGGAGIQADIKTVSALGGFAMTAITAITVQNTRGVTGIHAVPIDTVIAQADAVMEDLGADAIKIGMLGEPALIAAVDDWLADHVEAPVVLDPVMVATSGDVLVPDASIDALRALATRAAVITPNRAEARLLTGSDIVSAQDQEAAGKALLASGCGAALVKGGHGDGEALIDVLVTPEGVAHWSDPRIPTTNTHGTGCTLASAIALGLGAGKPLADAVTEARTYVRGAIQHAPGIGGGHGPLDHGWMLRIDAK